jgi:hypothetical protein
LAAAAVTLVVAFFVWVVMVASGAAISVISVGLATICAGFFVNYAVEATDKFIGRTVTHDHSNTDGTSSLIAAWIRKAERQVEGNIQANWNYLMYKMSADYREIQF